MASCCCHNLCAQDRCLLAQGAFGSPLTIPALWCSKSGGPTKAKRCKPYYAPRKSPSNERFRQTESWVAFLLMDSERSTLRQNKKKKRRGHPEGNRPSFRFSPCATPPAAGQGGRETLTWPPVKRACQNLLGFRGGTNPEERETLQLCSVRPCANWTGPVRNLDRHGPAGQQESREGEKVRDAVGIERVCEVSPSHRVF